MYNENKLLSNITHFDKYAKYLPDLYRRETFEETILRYENMMLKRFPHLNEEIKTSCDFIRVNKVLPSMRALQFSGEAVERNEARIYNCGFTTIKTPKRFAELMFLLLSGTGVGYSVQKRHTSQLPPIKSPGKPVKFVIADTIEGWADSVKALCKAYFHGQRLPIFDFADIRKKGTPLKVSGGKAPGPGPLMICLASIQSIFESKKEGEMLEPWEVSDICCHIANAVKSGGIRRAAMICIFDIDDQNMLHYKRKRFYDDHPERSTVNISAAAFREDVYSIGGTWHKLADKTTKSQFDNYFKILEENETGDPGIIWLGHPDYGYNPCCEIGLRDCQFCNLSTINLSAMEDQKDLIASARAASLLGTLQATFTNFHYLSEDWKDNCESEALIGVSITGIGDCGDYATKFNFNQAAEAVKNENEYIANKIGIPKAARCTAIKPEGTASIILATSSGVHGRHSTKYIRRLRFQENQAIVQYLSEKLPACLVKNQDEPNTVICEFPQESPEKSIMREEGPLVMLDRVRFFFENWVLPGHRKGKNKHNVSCTVSIKPHEYNVVKQWMWENKESYSRIATFPFDPKVHPFSPFEAVETDAQLNRFLELRKEINRVFNSIDLRDVLEYKDETDLAGEAACAGGKCEL